MNGGETLDLRRKRLAFLSAALGLSGRDEIDHLPATITATPDAVIVESTLAMNRKGFGINFAGAADNLIRDEVLLPLPLKGTK